MNSRQKPRRTSKRSSVASVVRSLVALSLLVLPDVVLAQAGLGLPRWAQSQIVERIKVSGYRRVSYHDHTVTGDDEAFELGNYGGQGDKRITDFGNVRVTGTKVLNAINFDFVFQDTRFQDPQGQKFNVNYAEGLWKADLGDVRGSMLGGNRFATFNKTLRGVSLGYEGGGFQAKSIYSDVRGAPRTVSFNGTNSAGPYYLQSAQIVRGTETIQVDGVQQVLGQDYTINYETGSVTFVNRSTLEAKIISPTSTIVATYEVFGFTGSRGRVSGLGMSYNWQGVATFGVTGLEQRVGGSGDLSTRLEKFQGFGPASTPYFLQFAPLQTEPIVVRVNGILQTDGVDYYFDPDNTSIFYFNRFMPATDEIDVLYTPTPTRTVEGDRQTLGWDVHVPIRAEEGKGVVSYSQATGKLFNTPTPSTGLARAIDLRYQQGRLTFSGGARDVPPTYVSIETVGFNRNEKAHDLRTEYRADKSLKLETSTSNSSISVRNVDNLGNVTFSTSRFTRLTGGLSYTPTGGSPWSTSHTRVRSHAALGETRVDTTDMRTSWAGAGWDASVSLQHQDAKGPVSATESRSVGLDTVALRTKYAPKGDWSFGMSTGVSNVRSGGETGTGRDVQASVSWRPSDRLGGSFVYQDSDAGQIATLGQFSSGYGSGYGGNGFSGGTGLSPLSSASKVRSMTGRMNFSPTSSLGFSARAYTRDTQGSFSSNTNTKGVGFDVNWNPDQYWSLQTSVDSSRTMFLNSSVSTANTVFSAFLDGAPPGRATWHLGANTMFSGGGGLFDQESATIDFSAGYLLAPRHSLSLVYYATTSTGTFAQDDSDLSLNYQYRIWRSLALQGSYRVRRVVNKDLTATTGAYDSRGFDIELVFNFGA